MEEQKISAIILEAITAKRDEGYVLEEAIQIAAHEVAKQISDAYLERSILKSVKEINREQVHHPDHYGGADNPYEVIKVLEHWLTRDEFIGALKFNIFKYPARANAKDGDVAYGKASWYASYLADFGKRNPA